MSAVILIMVMIVSCNRQMSDANHSTTTLGADYFAKSTFEEEYDLSWNVPKDYCLITKSLKSKQNDINSTIYYQVYDAGTDTIVLSDKIVYGQIRWNDYYHLRLVKTPGKVEPKNIPINNYLLDVRNGKVSPIKTK